MSGRHRLTTVETVEEEDAWLFTVRDDHDEDVEVFLVPCADEADGIEAWINSCTHEAQALYREDVGAVVREGSIVCPKHGSAFDTCSGYCDNGPAAETTLPAIDITVEDGQVYLTDDDVRFLYEGPSRNDDDGGDAPSSTSHLRF
ncbi:rieske [2Fe-2S] domain protein [Halalkalicoccus paucihalophilus]|jgi:nitrite reductase/ring-hydroxylating ferredoxin subunit|uniref:Rieske [2Fe-2S] domain protein n=1 Tax=Halalkalicoccus paucihalophilus TaxID=1008153 RepID=A0A151AFF7_9EURY|nr:Rieske 2Fe-2S domain-containing protein [Halalkalicoccus paucihalophilus]KYH26292.1 rieske [2Fe-2S] domain protein [Halalkalicoccus paucihalophilus]